MTMANAPLWDWTAGDIDSGRVEWKQEYFRKESWTGQITFSRSANSPPAQTRKVGFDPYLEGLRAMTRPTIDHRQPG